MIAFGTSITSPEVYERSARVGIQLAAEADSEVYELPSIGSIFSSYNVLLERAAGRDDLEALVLVHQDTEIVDRDFCARIRQALTDPDVGLVGCVGAIGARSIAWWEASVSLASFVHRFEEHGGGELPAFSWTWDQAPPYARTGEVDTLDGFLLALSPWVVRHVRFDESLGQFHGYDFDFCLQVRAAGKKVVTADLRAIHAHSLRAFTDPEEWIEAHIKVADKWSGRMPEVGWRPGSWQQRTHRAQAGRDTARLVDYANKLGFEAQIRELEGAIEEARSSIGWRITAPLRGLGRLLAQLGASRREVQLGR